MARTEAKDQRFPGGAGGPPPLETRAGDLVVAGVPVRRRRPGVVPILPEGLGPEAQAPPEEAARILAIPFAPILSVIGRVRGRRSGPETPLSPEYPFDHFLKIPVIQPGERLNNVHDQPAVVATVFERDRQTGAWSPVRSDDEAMGTMAYSPEHEAVVVFDQGNELDDNIHVVHWDPHLTERRLNKPQNLKHLQIEPLPPTQVVELDKEAKVEAGADYVVRVWGAVVGEEGMEPDVTQPLRVGCISIFLRGLNRAQVERVAEQLGVPLETNLVNTGLDPGELVQRINRGLVPDELPEAVVQGIFRTFAKLFGAGVAAAAEGSDLPEEERKVLKHKADDEGSGGTIWPGARGIFNLKGGLAEAA